MATGPSAMKNISIGSEVLKETFTGYSFMPTTQTPLTIDAQTARVVERELLSLERRNDIELQELTKKPEPFMRLAVLLRLTAQAEAAGFPSKLRQSPLNERLKQLILSKGENSHESLVAAAAFSDDPNIIRMLKKTVMNESDAGFGLKRAAVFGLGFQAHRPDVRDFLINQFEEADVTMFDPILGALQKHTDDPKVYDLFLKFLSEPQRYGLTPVCCGMVRYIADENIASLLLEIPLKCGPEGWQAIRTALNLENQTPQMRAQLLKKLEKNDYLTPIVVELLADQATEPDVRAAMLRILKEGLPMNRAAVAEMFHRRSDTIQLSPNEATLVQTIHEETQERVALRAEAGVGYWWEDRAFYIMNGPDNQTIMMTQYVTDDMKPLVKQLDDPDPATAAAAMLAITSSCDDLTGDSTIRLYKLCAGLTRHPHLASFLCRAEGLNYKDILNPFRSKTTPNLNTKPPQRSPNHTRTPKPEHLISSPPTC